MLPKHWLEFLNSHALSGRCCRLDEHQDESGVGADLCFFTEQQAQDEASNYWPGIGVLADGYVPVASCSVGSGDPYFIRLADGPNGKLYRIYHDSVTEAGYKPEVAIAVVLSNYEQALAHVEA
jgi:hypothetical protein